MTDNQEQLRKEVRKRIKYPLGKTFFVIAAILFILVLYLFFVLKYHEYLLYVAAFIMLLIIGSITARRSIPILIRTNQTLKSLSNEETSSILSEFHNVTSFPSLSVYLTLNYLLDFKHGFVVTPIWEIRYLFIAKNYSGSNMQEMIAKTSDGNEAIFAACETYSRKQKIRQTQLLQEIVRRNPSIQTGDANDVLYAFNKEIYEKAKAKAERQNLKEGNNRIM